MSKWLFPEYWAPDGKCDSMISALKLVTYLTEGNKLAVVQGFTESRKNRLAEARESFIAVDNTRALVTMGELAQFKEVHRIVPPNFNKANYEDAERGRRRRGLGASPGRTRVAATLL